jgi:hypothetical protein
MENLKTVLGDEPGLLWSFANTAKGVWIGGDRGADALVASSLDVRSGKGFHIFPELDVLPLGLFALAAGFVPGFRTALGAFR